MPQTEKFETRPITVQAYRVWVDTPVLIPGKGVRHATAGTWIVEGQYGAQLIVPDDIFREMYRPMSTAAETLWKEETKKVWAIWPDGMGPNSPN